MKKLLIVFTLVVLLCVSFGCQKTEEVAEEVEKTEAASYALNSKYGHFIRACNHII